MAATPNIQLEAVPAVLAGGTFDANVSGNNLNLTATNAVSLGQGNIYLNGNVVMGQNTSSTVGFYGVTGIAQPGATTPLTNTATGTQIATAVNDIITKLTNFGLMA